MARESTPRRRHRRSPSRSRTDERRRRRRHYDDEMRGRRARAQPPTPRRRHGETGGEGRRRRRCDERSEDKKVEVVEEGRVVRRLRSEIGEVSGSLRRITRGEFLAAEVAARSPPPPPSPFSSQAAPPGGTDGLLFDGAQGGVHGGAVAVHASSSLSQPAAPRPTVRTSSSAAAADLEPPPKAVATASSTSNSNKRKTGPESSEKASTKRTKTISARGHPEVHRQQNKSSSAPTPTPTLPKKVATRFPAIPLPPPNCYYDEAAALERKKAMLERYAGTIAKAQRVIAGGDHDDVLKGPANFAAEEELLPLRRDAERAKAREALQEVEREARRTGGLFVERIRPEHLRELDITGDIEYVVSPDYHRDEDGVLRFTPPRYSPVMVMLGLFVKAEDGGEPKSIDVSNILP